MRAVGLQLAMDLIHKKAKCKHFLFGDKWENEICFLPFFSGAPRRDDKVEGAHKGRSSELAPRLQPPAGLRAGARHRLLLRQPRPGQGAQGQVPRLRVRVQEGELLRNTVVRKQSAANSAWFVPIFSCQKKQIHVPCRSFFLKKTRSVRILYYVQGRKWSANSGFHIRDKTSTELFFPFSLTASCLSSARDSKI